MTATIRPIRPTDFARILRFRHQAESSQITAHHWPNIQPESARFPVPRILSHSVARAAGARVLGAWRDQQLDGLVVGRPRSSGVVWDIERLYGADDQTCADLLDQLGGFAVRAGARRVFIQSPAESRGRVIAQKAGYERYMSERLYRLVPPFNSKLPNPFPARPRLRADEQSLFQLYCAAVPAQVRAAEAMTREEWLSLHHGPRIWKPSLFGDRHQYLWQYGEVVVAWLEIVYGARSQFLEFVLHPDYERLLDGMIASALAQTSEKAPVYASARTYQDTLASGLERVGFVEVANTDLYVRQLAARSLEPALVPAKLVSG
ncbi:MAG: hypothetical protein ACKVVP_01435 [Chloroflexota bacterium]